MKKVKIISLFPELPKVAQKYKKSGYPYSQFEEDFREAFADELKARQATASERGQMIGEAREDLRRTWAKAE